MYYIPVDGVLILSTSNSWSAYNYCDISRKWSHSKIEYIWTFESLQVIQVKSKLRTTSVIFHLAPRNWLCPLPSLESAITLSEVDTDVLE